MTVILKASYIEWNTNGEEVHGLPTSISVEVDLQDQRGWSDINNQICDQLRDITGYRVLGYLLEGCAAPKE